jgi:hypothetical protein
VSKTEFCREESFEEFAKRTIDSEERWNPLSNEECVCGPSPMPKPKPVVLHIGEGSYEVTGSRYPLLRLAVEVLKHRTWHWMRGEGFRD